MFYLFFLNDNENNQQHFVALLCINFGKFNKCDVVDVAP